MPEGTPPVTPGAPPARARRAGKRQARSVETREKILDAAEALFAGAGFDRTATKAIADRAEVPGGLIFYHFPTKLAILLALIEERGPLPVLKAALGERLTGDARTVLTEIVNRFLAALRTRERVVVILLQEIGTHPEVAGTLRMVKRQGTALVARQLDDLVERGELRPVATTTIARILLAQTLFVAVIERDPDAERIIEEAVDLIVAGFATTSGTSAQP